MNSTSSRRVFRAPGRVNLIGEHTDYTGGLVLPAAISLGITLSCECADRIELHSRLDSSSALLGPDGSSAQALSGWTRYAAAVARELDELGRPPVGIVGIVESDLPVGAGLASSAALEVVVATALCAAAEWDALSPLEVAGACQKAEYRAVGVPCGILDQVASILGEDGAAIYLDCANLEHEPVPLPEGLALVVVDSGITRRLEHSGYARRRREIEEAVAVLGHKRAADVSLGEAAEMAMAAGLDDLRWRRLRHLVTENERVRAFVRALTAGDLPEIGAILYQGHVSQRDDLETSTPEIDALVERAYELGAVGARMTGGGFGGTVIALVNVEQADAFAATIGGARTLICSAVTGAGEMAVHQ